MLEEKNSLSPDRRAILQTNRRLLALMLFAFLTAFVFARIIVYAVVVGIFPNLFLYIRGVHIHHFTYGVVILAIVGMYFILRRPALTALSFRLMTILYGLGLGLTFDEFGMWIRLEDNYWIRQSYDAIIIITLLLLNLIYWRYLIIGLSEIFKIITFPIRLPFRIIKKSP